MEGNQVSNQDHEQQFKAVLDAIDAFEKISEETEEEEWDQVDAQLTEALNNFNFKFTLDQINKILYAAEEVNLILFDFVFEFLDKCDDGILDQKAAEGLLRHCSKLNDDDFKNFLKKVNEECREEIKEIREKQFEEISNAILNFIEMKQIKSGTEEWDQAAARLDEALENFQFDFDKMKIWIILKYAKFACLNLGSSFVLEILDRCDDKILDKEVAEGLLRHCSKLNDDDFNKFLNKVNEECREEIKEIREKQFEEILDAINNKEKKSGTEKGKKADAPLAEALNKFNFEFTLDQINKILDAAKDANLNLGFDFVFEMLDKCDYGILDQETAKGLLEHCNRLNDDWYEYFLSKCDSEARIVKEYQLKKATQQNKNRGILGGIGVTFGVLFGLGAIGLGTAVGIGALTITIAAPIVAAAVGLALIAFGSYFVDKFRVNKVLNKISGKKLNEQDVSENEIPFDLRKRKEIQNALDESRKPLLQDTENEIV